MKRNHLAAAFIAAVLPFSALAADAKKGHDTFIKKGCWQCHGTVGQGALTGPTLAPNPKPLAFMQVFVRNSPRAMPPYPEAILSNDELADIHAYLSSIQKSPDYKSIPLLNQ